MKKQIFTICAIFVLAGCGIPIRYQLPTQDIRVKKDKIYHNGNLFAELRYYYPFELADNPNEAYSLRGSIRYKGVAMYYFNEKKLIWIFPKRGLEKASAEGQCLSKGKNDAYFIWAFNIRISRDGKYVYYKKHGLFKTKQYIYSVEKGISKSMDKNWYLF